MNDIKAAKDLLEIARRTLQSDVLPQQTGQTKYACLMIGRALEVYGRSLDAGPAPECPFPTTETLCADIRAGRCDPGRADNHTAIAWLKALNTHELSISNPKALASAVSQNH